jgi:uncharacterized protein (TIGR02145 family)
MKEFYYSIEKEQFGPFSLEELKEKKITTEVLVWHEGLENWTKASDIEELAGILKTLPPPLPQMHIAQLPPLPNANTSLRGIIKDKRGLLIGILVAALIICCLIIIIISTKTKNKGTISTVTDYDGNIYHTVIIGTQIWMVENLKVTHYRNGDAIPNITDNDEWSHFSSGAYSNYDNNVNYADDYGRLYNWYAVNDSRSICPAGWHVPSDGEWTTLINFLGGEDVAGDKLKSTSKWDSPNTTATNSSGFNAIPGGSRVYFGNFINFGGYGEWWSSTEDDTDRAWSRTLNSNKSRAYRSISYHGPVKNNGFSVRCLRD